MNENNFKVALYLRVSTERQANEGDSLEEQEKELVPYPKEKQIVELIFSKFLETRSTTAVMHYLNENGFTYRDSKLWDKRQIQQMLKQESYLGKVTWGGKVYEGIHQPIITPTTFEKVQQIFQSKTYTKDKSTTNALLAKKVFCAKCSSPLAPSHTTNQYKQKYFYYRCTGSKDKSQKCQRPIHSPKPCLS